MIAHRKPHMRSIFPGLLLGATLSGQSLQHLGNNPLGPDITVDSVGARNGVRAFHSYENPLIAGRNVYAPDFIRNGTWNCYFGGWLNSNDTNDRIYLAVADDFAPEGPLVGPHHNHF